MLPLIRQTKKRQKKQDKNKDDNNEKTDKKNKRCWLYDGDDHLAYDCPMKSKIKQVCNTNIKISTKQGQEESNENSEASSNEEFVGCHFTFFQNSITTGHEDCMDGYLFNEDYDHYLNNLDPDDCQVSDSSKNFMWKENKGIDESREEFTFLKSDCENLNYAYMQGKKDDSDLKNLILLNNQSTTDLFGNKHLLRNITNSEKTLRVISNGG